MRAQTALGLAGIAAIVGLAAASASFATHAFAQGTPNGAPAGPPNGPPPGPHTYLQATVNDPPGALFDPTRITFTPPGQIKWTGNEALLYGTPNKPGDPYGLLVKLSPGQFSAPHTLSKERWVFVVSGTLWVSNSNSFDPKSTYPVTADNFVTNLANSNFWDGNRIGATEPTTIFISGVGSADNHILGEYAQKTDTSVSVKDPAGPAPDASRITIKPIATTGNVNLYGGGQDATVDGTAYGVVQTWTAGRTSSPHYHPTPRYIYVLQGPWWVSSSTFHDTRLTYPVPSGSFVQDIPHGIHWDGNRIGATDTVRLYITGIAPATNHGVDEDGKELPPRVGGRRGAGRGAGDD